MNRKQVFGLLLAFVLLAGSFLITSAVNRSEKSKEDNSPSMLESLGSYLAGDSFNINLPDEDFIAYLDVSGAISENETYSSSYSHSFNLNYIDALVESRYNIGLIMYMNSSGGSVYASDELYLAKRQPEDLFSAISGLLRVPAHTILQWRLMKSMLIAIR